MSTYSGSENHATTNFEPAVSSSPTVLSSANSFENTSLAQVGNSDTQIPEIPSIPSELLIPPRASRSSVGEQKGIGKNSSFKFTSLVKRIFPFSGFNLNFL